MSNKYLDTDLLDRAIVFAVHAHHNTERRGKGFPYIVHPMEAVEVVASITPDQELLAAAALHDTIEDTDVTVDDIRREFGDRVAELVHAESDQFTEGVSEEDSWHDRKQAAIDRLRNASHDAKIVAMGDKLSNMRAIWRDYQTKGDELWNIFHVKDKASHEWHYRGLADSLSELSDTFAYREFLHLINEVFES
ncbi:MAG: bifunctional (p)ppGpp synthetase/guanosine-3',5'-bis(diphosphate) 3'-pyrophosphohydrolase [Paludibacteraceae bacterium]|nr:bifunctional (p)ppGpp synthetase/guanosine-3',5'-bis(diphosphate) 3'-pyrophosphohydrolase [Paludibacteraceae bacterium]